jgi:hypothetical protein
VCGEPGVSVPHTPQPGVSEACPPQACHPRKSAIPESYVGSDTGRHLGGEVYVKMLIEAHLLDDHGLEHHDTHRTQHAFSNMSVIYQVTVINSIPADFPLVTDGISIHWC